MKHTRIFLTATLLAAMSTNLQAQVWGTSAAQTYTGYHVGINATSCPADAHLHIFGVVGNVSIPSLIGYDNNPEIKLDRTTYNGGIGYSVPNFFEVWNAGSGGTGSPLPSVLLDVINPQAWLGILQSSPSAPLDVNGAAFLEQNLTVGTTASVGTNLTVAGNTTTQTLSVGTTASVGTNLTVASNTTTQTLSVGTTATVGTNLVVNNMASIGTSTTPGAIPPLPTPSGYSLYVANGILTEKVNVALSTSGNWSDFVFNKDYSLMPLSKLESYVNANKHLPEVPSASEVAKDGIDVATMDAKLLQKIEELTLYVIDQQKQIDELKQGLKK